MPTSPVLPPNLPIPPSVPPLPGAGFDVPDPLESPAVPSVVNEQQQPKRRHVHRWIFLSIGIFIAVVLIVAVIFIAYRLVTISSTTPITSPLPTATIPPAIPTNSAEVPGAMEEIVAQDTSDIADPDQDGLTNAEERFYGTDPNKADTDADGYKDSDEVKNGYNPLGLGKLDSDNDGFPDPDERTYGTDPFNPDTDRDGYSDGAEITGGYNPLIVSPNDKL